MSSSQDQTDKQTLEQAIQLNNTGVNVALSSENVFDEKALPYFLKGLNILKRLMATTSNDDNATDEDETDTSNIPSSLLHSLSSRPLSHFEASDNFFLFQSLLSMQMPLTATGQTREANTSDYHVFSAMIILNLAILHHRQAIQVSSTPKAAEENALAMEKAERFYNMVLKITMNQASSQQNLSSPSQSTGGTELMLQLASINNLASVYLTRSEMESANWALSTLACVVQTSQVEQDILLHQEQQRLRSSASLSPSGPVHEDVIEGMLLNALVSSNSSNMAAAA